MRPFAAVTWTSLALTATTASSGVSAPGSTALHAVPFQCQSLCGDPPSTTQMSFGAVPDTDRVGAPPSVYVCHIVPSRWNAAVSVNAQTSPPAAATHTLRRIDVATSSFVQVLPFQ